MARNDPMDVEVGGDLLPARSRRSVMPKEDASQLILAPDEAMRELLEFAGLQVPEDADLKFVRAAGDVRISQRLVTGLALEALATIKFLARRGHFNAAKFLVDRCLGQAEAPFSDQAQRLNEAEVAQKLFELYRKKGYSEAIARKMAERGGEFSSADPPEERTP